MMHNLLLCSLSLLETLDLPKVGLEALEGRVFLAHEPKWLWLLILDLVRAITLFKFFTSARQIPLFLELWLAQYASFRAAR